jgi:hypothetical protein
LAPSAWCVKSQRKFPSAQLSAVHLSDDLHAKVNAPTVEELIAEIKIEYQKLGPFLDLEVLPEPQRSRTEGGLTMGGRAVEYGRRPGA